MGLQCLKLFHSKVSSGILQQDSQSSYSFGKIRNIGGPELSEEKIQCFIGERFLFLFSDIFFHQFWFLFSSFSQSSVMISFNIETLNSGRNLPLQASFIKFNVAIASFKNLLKMDSRVLKGLLIPKFLEDFCDKICRVHTVLARSKMQEAQNFLKKKYL